MLSPIAIGIVGLRKWLHVRERTAPYVAEPVVARGRIQQCLVSLRRSVASFATALLMRSLLVEDLLQDRDETVNVHKRVIQRHGCDPDHIRVPPAALDIGGCEGLVHLLPGDTHLVDA